MDLEQPTPQIVRLSLPWIMIGVVLILGLGILGGVLAQQFLAPPPPLLPEENVLRPTIQQITVSPNKAQQQLVSEADRAVVLVSTQELKQFVVSGLVMTNDGLVVTTGELNKAALFAYDSRGVPAPLQVIGQDLLFGLSYVRLESGVLPPLDVAERDPAVGERLLVMSRSQNSFGSKAYPYDVYEYVVPAENDLQGIQRLVRGTTLPDSTLNGSAVINEEGKTVGIMVDALKGLVLPISHIQASLQRVTHEQRELDPWQEAGLKVEFDWQALESNTPVQFVARVTQIQALSPAAKAGVQTGDLIVMINNESLSPEKLVSLVLADSATPQLGVRRGAETLQIPLAINP